jgi:hypothetical protein
MVCHQVANIGCGFPWFLPIHLKSVIGNGTGKPGTNLDLAVVALGVVSVGFIILTHVALQH